MDAVKVRVNFIFSYKDERCLTTETARIDVLPSLLYQRLTQQIKPAYCLLVIQK